MDKLVLVTMFHLTKPRKTTKRRKMEAESRVLRRQYDIGNGFMRIGPVF